MEEDKNYYLIDPEKSTSEHKEAPTRISRRDAWAIDFTAEHRNLV